MNGPDELTNVVRWEFSAQINFIDRAAGLRLFAGLPTVPSSFIGCRSFGFTGSELFQFVTDQRVGINKGATNALLLNQDRNFHLYRTAGFNGFCRATVYAQGIGHQVNNDNDIYGLWEHTNAWGYHFVGRVTILATGEEKTLNAKYRFIYNPETDTFKVIHSSIELL